MPQSHRAGIHNRRRNPLFLFGGEVMVSKDVDIAFTIPDGMDVGRSVKATNLEIKRIIIRVFTDPDKHYEEAKLERAVEEAGIEGRNLDENDC